MAKIHLIDENVRPSLKLEFGYIWTKHFNFPLHNFGTYVV